jgi:hypothetical protein
MAAELEQMAGACDFAGGAVDGDAHSNLAAWGLARS